MSLKWDCKEFYTKDYPSLSLEILQKASEALAKDISYIQSRRENFKCSCLPDNVLILVEEDREGVLRAQFPRLLRTSIPCSSCEKCLAPFPSHLAAVGYCWMDHYDPRLLLKMSEYQHQRLKKAILAKQKDYPSLTNAELEELVKQFFAKTDEDIIRWEVIEFELKSRRLRGLD